MAAAVLFTGDSGIPIRLPTATERHHEEEPDQAALTIVYYEGIIAKRPNSSRKYDETIPSIGC